MSSNRRWLILCLAAVMTVVALPALAQSGPAPTSPPQRVVGGWFCSVYLTDDFVWEDCYAVFAACMNGYDTNVASLKDCGNPPRPCLCFSVSLFPPTDPVSCQSAYDSCRSPGEDQNPPTTIPPP